MKKALVTFLTLACGGMAFAQDDIPAYPRVKLETTEGTVLMELDGRRAPLTVKHFLALVESGYYDGTIFHRVIPNFVAQAGGFDRDFKRTESDAKLVNESGNGLTNLRGTVAMARLQEPHTANAQFFINLADNRSLDPQSNRWGYAVFGYVVEGMDVVDKIAEIPTGPGGRFAQDVPVVSVIIERATRADN